jgi:hypothetical protein
MEKLMGRNIKNSNLSERSILRNEIPVICEERSAAAIQDLYAPGLLPASFLAVCNDGGGMCLDCFLLRSSPFAMTEKPAFDATGLRRRSGDKVVMSASATTDTHPVTPPLRHCEERSDAAIQYQYAPGLLPFVRNDGEGMRLDCFPSFAMTVRVCAWIASLRSQ